MDEKLINEKVQEIQNLDKLVQTTLTAMKDKVASSDFKVFEDKVNAAQDALGKEIAKLKLPQFSAQDLAGAIDEKKSVEHKAYGKALRQGRERLTPDEAKVLTISDDTTGGYLALPTDYEAEIIKSITLMSPVRQLARVRQTSGHTVGAVKQTASFSASRTAEIATRTETTGLTYGKEEMSLPEAYALVRVSNQDVEDSKYNLEGEINFNIAEQMGVLEGTEFITGTGVGKMEGILTHADLKVENTGCIHTATTVVIVIDDLLAVQYLLKEGYVRNAKWIMKRDVAGYLRKLKSATTGEYYWQPSVQAGAPAMLLGSPVIECPDMTGLTANAPVQNTYPVGYGDFSRGYLFAERLGTTVQKLVELYAASGQVGFLARRRFNGQIVLSEAIKLLMIE